MMTYPSRLAVPLCLGAPGCDNEAIGTVTSSGHQSPLPVCKQHVGPWTITGATFREYVLEPRIRESKFGDYIQLPLDANVNTLILGRVTSDGFVPVGRPMLPHQLYVETARRFCDGEALVVWPVRDHIIIPRALFEGKPDGR